MNYVFIMIIWKSKFFFFLIKNLFFRAILKILINIKETIGSNEAWIGFTAATGGLYQSHDILNWKFSIMKQQVI